VLLLAACGGSGGGSSPGGPVAGGITIVGTVLNGRGQPLAVIPVIVEGHTPVVTDAAGQFVIAGVAVPYTLILIPFPGQQVRVVAGLTRPDPSFSFSADFNPSTATIAGTTSGGAGFPLPANHTTYVSYRLEADNSVGNFFPSPTTGDWGSLPTEWQGPLSTTARFFALQFARDPAGLAVNFTGVATLDVPIANGDALSGLNIALGGVATATISGSVNAPPGWGFQGKGLLIRHTNGSDILLPSDVGLLNTFSLATADAPGLSTRMTVTLNAPGGGTVKVFRGNVPVPAAGYTIDVPTETVLLSPPNGAVDVGHATPFHVSHDTDRVFAFFWAPTGPGPVIALTTSEPTATIPDLSAYGLGIPPGTTYEWFCQVVGSGLTVDDFGAGGPTSLIDLDAAFIQFTGMWTFTTGP